MIYEGPHPLNPQLKAMKHELHRCPCGSDPSLEDHRLRWMVACDSCGALIMGDRAPEPDEDMPDSYWESFEQSAVDKWNSWAESHYSHLIL